MNKGKGVMKGGIILSSLFILVLSVLSVSFVFATSCPTSPKNYVGNVYYNGNLLVRDYEVRAMIAGKDVGIGTVTTGHYSISVYPECLSGTITFYVNGVSSNETSSFSSGTTDFSTVNIDLLLNAMPPLQATCGNGVIDGGEECDGNNFGTTVCSGSGYLFCNSDCTIDYTNCLSVSQIPASSENNASNQTTTFNQTSNTTQNSGGGITGGVIGALGGSNTVYYIIGGIVLLVIIIAIARSGKKKENKVEPFEVRE